jgi:hypothetical protein
MMMLTEAAALRRGQVQGIPGTCGRRKPLAPLIRFAGDATQTDRSEVPGYEVGLRPLEEWPPAKQNPGYYVSIFKVNYAYRN